MVTTVPQPVITYPREDELTITLKVRTESPEDREYFVLESGEIQPGFLADLFDCLDQIRNHLISVNGLTYKEVLKILQGM